MLYVSVSDASRMQVGEQWYSRKEGMQRLHLFKVYFEQAGYEVKMYKDIVTHDMHFGLNSGYCLDFPANFPTKMPIIRAPDGKTYGLKLGPTSVKDVCKFVVDSFQDLFRRQHPRSGRRWHLLGLIK